MDLYLTGDTGPILAGADILAMDLGITLCPGGLPVEAVRGRGLEVSLCEGRGRIIYGEPIEFFRGLGLFVQMARCSDDFTHHENACFEKNGVMFDVSRGGVPTPDTVQYLLRRMALMGLNMIMLYTEDVYEVPGRPYFGYMRGRYTRGELRELDDYAQSLGIEMIPCIQTLGHLETALRWSREMGTVTDTPSVLLAGCEETYEFLEEIITAAAAPFKSRRIHIGMDEAWNLGLGRYLKKNGYQESHTIMARHLERVGQIVRRHGLKPMMWGDMFFRMSSPTGSYYDTDSPIPQEVLDAIPEDMALIYWDYYHRDEDHYRDFIERYRQFGKPLLFAGSTWTSRGPIPKYGRSFINTIPALSQCKKCGVTQVINTIWCDDGSENSLLTALPGMQLYAEMGYGDYDEENLARRFAACTGIDLESFLTFSRFDGLGRDIPHEYENGNITRCLLYQDPLLGLFDRDVADLPLHDHYRELRDQMGSFHSDEALIEDLYRFYEALAAFMEIKAGLGLQLTAAYREKDRDKLAGLVGETIPHAMGLLGDLHSRWRSLWLRSNKPMGLEVIEIRLGGVNARLETAIERVNGYLGGRYTRLEELEAERLPFARCDRGGSPEFDIVSRYAHTVSACDLVQYLPF